jgi:hypothetical protein
MQPPGAGGKDCLAASQVVGAGFAVAVDEGLIALQASTLAQVFLHATRGSS